MKKSDAIVKLKEKKIIAVIRGSDYETGMRTCISCIEGGITAIEMAYSNNNASSIIKDLREKYTQKVIIGAGTVLDAPTARSAIMNGAQFIVSPSFDKETALLCNTYEVPYIPGCMTVKEILTGMKYGSEIIKIFPGETLGQSYLKAIKSPLPQVTLMITGGVNKNNLKDWLKAGADCLGIGGELNKLASENKYDEVKELASLYVKEVSL